MVFPSLDQEHIFLTRSGTSDPVGENGSSRADIGIDVHTAHVYWDRVWRTEEGRAAWSTPDPWVAETVRSLRHVGVRDVLDLGCGTGRHALHLAAAGYAVRAVDRSAAAVAFTRAEAARHGLSVTADVAHFTAMPYPDAGFDLVLAFNVVYHGDEDGLGRTLAEVRRVLRPGGHYLCTMLSKRNAQYGRGRQVAPNTFVQPGADDDKAHPHLYADAADLTRLHDGFRPLDRFEAEQSSPGSHHWYCVFRVDGHE